MSKTVLIACKLPSGFVLDGLTQPLLLNGTNTALVPGAPGLTHVDADEWTYISAMYAEHAAFKSNAIFASGSDKVTEVLAQADELKDEATGLEGLDPKKPDATGLLKPDDETKLNKQLEVAATTTTPRRQISGAADKSAALEAATMTGAKPAGKGKGK